MSHLYKKEKNCECGYTTFNRGNWSTHKNSCKSIRKNQTSGDKERIASLEKQLVAKDEHYQKELATKDEQIKELIQIANSYQLTSDTSDRKD